MGIYRKYANGWTYGQFGNFAKQLQALTNNHSVVLEFLGAQPDESIAPGRCSLMAVHLRTAAGYPEMVEHAPVMLAIASEMLECAENNHPFVVQ